MSASAPASAASIANAEAAVAVAADTPAITGTRPPAARTVAATTLRRSAALSEPASPIVPVATKPCTPASSSAPRLRSSASKSIAPSASNGVVTAGMMPGKRTSVLLVCGHVASHPLEVLGGVEGRRGGVAVEDRLVDHAVLGRVHARAARLGDRVVAQPLPERLVHQGGDLVGEAGQDGVGRERGELAVEAAVAVVPACALAVGGGGVHRVEQALGLVVAAAAARGQRGNAGLDQQPRLEQVERPCVVGGQGGAGREPVERVGGDERPCARPRLEHAAQRQRGDRLAHRCAADLQPARELALGRQPRAGHEPPGADVGSEPLGDPLVALRLPQWADHRTNLSPKWFVHRTSTVHVMPSKFNAVDPATGRPVAADREARAALLRGAAARLRAAGDEVVAVAGSETGLPEGRLRSELERTAGQLEAFAAVLDAGDYVEAIIDTPDPDAKPIPRPDVRRMLIPIGPVAVFGASNFPLAFSTAGGDTASALAAGCPVVVKGHPSHPGTGELVAREVRAAAAEAGLPDGTFAHLLAAGVAVGEALVDAPAIAAVGFTGSTAGGRAIADRAARRPAPIPVYAEMGSINPIVVTDAALAARAEAIADGLVASVSNFGGQLCTKPGVVFVPAGDAGDEFARTVARRLDDVEPTVLLNERLRDALAAAVERLAARPEVRPLGDARAFEGEGYRHQPAAYEAPASAVAEGAELLEEHFGPVVVLLRYGSRDELLAALGRVEGQLTGSIHAQPDEDAELLRILTDQLARRAGRVVYDGFPTGVAVTHGMHHGGPYPATSAPAHTSVGMTAIRRFLRPVAWQDAPAAVLPPELRDDNPLGIWRRVDGELTRDPLRRSG